MKLNQCKYAETKIYNIEAIIVKTTQANKQANKQRSKQQKQNKQRTETDYANMYT